MIDGRFCAPQAGGAGERRTQTRILSQDVGCSLEASPLLAKGTTQMILIRLHPKEFYFVAEK
jgi:hypothetical protein